MDCNTPGFLVHHHLREFAQTHIHWVSDAIQPSHPLLSPSLPSFNLSQHQGFFLWVSPSHQVAKYWSFSFSISPSSEYSGLILFRMDWVDLLAVQGTLKGLLQHHSSKASILQHSAFLWSRSHIRAWLSDTDFTEKSFVNWFFYFTSKEGKYKIVGQCDLKCVLSSVFPKFILLTLITEQQEETLRIKDKSVQPRKLPSSQISFKKDQ